MPVFERLEWKLRLCSIVLSMTIIDAMLTILKRLER